MKYIILTIAFLLTSFTYAEDNTFECFGGKYSGSAWYFTESKLCTAGHLFNDKNDRCYIVKNGIKISCKVLKLDKKLDICILEASELNNSWYEIKDLEVIGIGFAEDKEGKSENIGFITKFEANNRTVGGMSGGPLIEKKSREVFGMIVKNGSFGNKSVCKIVFGSTIREFIKDLK